MLSPRELSYRHLPGQARNWINEHLTYTHGYGAGGGPGEPHQPARGCPSSSSRTSRPGRRAASPTITRPEIYYGEIRQRVRRSSAPSRRSSTIPPGDQNVYTTLRGPGRHPGRLVPAQAGVRRAVRRAQDPPLRRPHRREPHHDVPRASATRVRQAAPVLALRPRSVPGGRPTTGASSGCWTATPPPTAIPIREPVRGHRQLHPELRQGDGRRLRRRR